MHQNSARQVSHPQKHSRVFKMTNNTNFVITNELQATIQKHVQAIAKSSFDLTIFMAYELTLLDNDIHKGELLDYFTTICLENDLASETAKRYTTDIKSASIYAAKFATFGGFKNDLKKHGITKVSHLPLWLGREKSLSIAIGKLPRDMRETLADKIKAVTSVQDVQSLHLEIKDTAAAAAAALAKAEAEAKAKAKAEAEAKAKTDAPKTDAPKTDAPKTDAPKTDAPKTDAPKTDAPKTDAPKTDAPKTDAPKTDAPKTDAPKTDAPKTDAPKTDAPKTDAPKLASKDILQAMLKSLSLLNDNDLLTLEQAITSQKARNKKRA
jgi:hypothetical protein